MRATDYAGRAVIVTGGTRGIGAEIARAFLRAGAQVLICGRTDPGAGVPLPRAGHSAARFTRADVRDPEQVTKLVGEAVERFGRLDVVVSNAGGAGQQRAAELRLRVRDVGASSADTGPCTCRWRSSPCSARCSSSESARSRRLRGHRPARSCQRIKALSAAMLMQAAHRLWILASMM